jgi:hypothetical protein
MHLLFSGRLLFILALYLRLRPKMVMIVGCCMFDAGCRCQKLGNNGFYLREMPERFH